MPLPASLFVINSPIKKNRGQGFLELTLPLLPDFSNYLITDAQVSLSTALLLLTSLSKGEHDLCVCLSLVVGLT